MSRAFIPDSLPHDPPLRYDESLLGLLSEADQELARLDTATEFLPNAELFVKMYVRKEAVLSSQIEGTQASLVDVLEHEARTARAGGPVLEVVNYVRAMNLGLERLVTLPLSLRLLCEIHGELLRGARGGERTRGEFRRSQNWIAPASEVSVTGVLAYGSRSATATDTPGVAAGETVSPASSLETER